MSEAPMPQARVRPSQVTIVVILIWIAFALTVVGAIATILSLIHI